MRLAPAHGKVPIPICDKIQTGPPVEPSLLLVSRRRTHRNTDIDMPQTFHLLTDNCLFPCKLPLTGHMDQVGPANAAAPCKRPGQGPYGFHTVGAGCYDFYDLACPEPVFPVMRLINKDPHPLPRQSETHKHDPSVYMSHAPALICVTLYLSFSLNTAACRLRAVAGGACRI